MIFDTSAMLLNHSTLRISPPKEIYVVKVGFARGKLWKAAMKVKFKKIAGKSTNFKITAINMA